MSSISIGKRPVNGLRNITLQKSSKLTAAQAGSRHLKPAAAGYRQITPDQYAGFLKSGFRHTISDTGSGYTATVPDRACNYLSWSDCCSYADWAALRPMTELEYEKGCRGGEVPVPNEYAWGSTVITQQTGHVGTDGSGTETASPETANCLYTKEKNSQPIDGPVRVGVYATATSGRQRAGAGCYGVMELSGNVWERCVTVGHAAGLAFRGTHGDGVLSANGHATNSDWPGCTGGEITGARNGATGAGFRGGGWDQPSSRMRVSNRSHASAVNEYLNRSSTIGGRAARSAP